MTKDQSSVYDIRDDRFRHLIVGNAELEELYSGCRWSEGPVWFADLNCLLFSDIPNQRILRWVPDGGVSVFRQPSNFRQWQYARPSGSLDLLRAWRPSRDADRNRRLDHGAGGQL